MDDDEDEDLWNQIVESADIAADDPESAIESLALDVSGIGNARSRQRFLEAARAYSQAGVEAAAAQHHLLPSATPEEVLRLATLASPEFQPFWADPASLVSGRSRGIANANEIEIGRGVNRNVAHLPLRASEGRAIRTETSLPTSLVDSSLGPFNLGGGTGSPHAANRRRRVFGFRVAFDNPSCPTGGDMGGCYLVGVTTSAFSSYGDQDGLQQTPLFWGIEDHGRKFEGSRRSRSARRNAEASPINSPYATSLSPSEVPFKNDRVLFGCREVITVVCDLDCRTMTFWRDDRLLGTLITSLPRAASLFPVVVPFNRGVACAITGMDRNPLPS